MPRTRSRSSAARRLRRNGDDNDASFAEAMDKIADAEWNQKQEKLTVVWSENFQYLTTAIYTLSIIVGRDHENEEGEKILRDAALAFMRTEAKQIQE